MKGSENKNSAAQIFSIWSDVVEKRLDPRFYLPYFTEFEKKISNRKDVETLGEIADYIGSGATPLVGGDAYISKEEGGIPFVRVTNLKDGQIDLSDVLYIKPEIHDGMLKRTQLEAGDLLLSMAGTIGLVAIVQDGIGEANINQALARIVLKGGYDNNYIAAVLSSKIGKIQTDRLSRPSVQANINLDEIRSIKLPIPVKKIQKEVVSKIQKAYAEKRGKEEEIKKIIASMDSFVLDELGIDTASWHERERERERVNEAAPETYFVWSDAVEKRLDPMYFHPLRLRAIEAIKRSGQPLAPLSEVVEFRREIVGEIPSSALYLGLENIVSNSGEYVGNNIKESVSSAFVFKRGDVLFPKLRPYLNKVFYADFDGVCSTEFHVLRAKRCQPFYLFAFLSRSVVVQQTSRLMTGNTLPRLQTGDVENLLVPLPDETKQEKIISGVQSFYTKMRNLRTEAAEVLANAQKQVKQMIIG